MSSLLRPATARTTLSRRIFSPSTFSRSYATKHQRPPPPKSPKSEPPRSLKSEPVVETFSQPSRPRPYYAKHPPFRELPRIKKRWPVAVGAVIVGLAGWAVFMEYMKNQEKISSSVVRQIMRSVRDDARLKEVLGEAIRPQPEWWLNGDPYIKGRISQLQGNVDVSFRIKGSKGSGTLYFTSIRKDKGLPFTILRFKVICDDGTIVLVDATPA